MDGYQELPLPTLDRQATGHDFSPVHIISAERAKCRGELQRTEAEMTPSGGRTPPPRLLSLQPHRTIRLMDTASSGGAGEKQTAN